MNFKAMNISDLQAMAFAGYQANKELTHRGVGMPIFAAFLDINDLRKNVFVPDATDGQLIEALSHLGGRLSEEPVYDVVKSIIDKNVEPKTIDATLYYLDTSKGLQKEMDTEVTVNLRDGSMRFHSNVDLKGMTGFLLSYNSLTIESMTNNNLYGGDLEYANEMCDIIRSADRLRQEREPGF